MEEQVKIEYSNAKGRFYIELNGNVVAEMTFTFSNTNGITIKHTHVKPEFNGRGFGTMMVAKAVEFAREKELKITPRCQYVKGVFDKTPSYGDVLCK